MLEALEGARTLPSAKKSENATSGPEFEQREFRDDESDSKSHNAKNHIGRKRPQKSLLGLRATFFQMNHVPKKNQT